MFNPTPDRNFNQYLFNPDECYSSSLSFEKTCAFLEYLSTDSDERTNEPLSLTEDILVIETKEGIFIRAQLREWCELLTANARAANDNSSHLTIIPLATWNNITTRYRSPIQSKGNERLARWRVGF